MSSDRDVDGPLGETVAHICATASSGAAEERITRAVLGRSQGRSRVRWYWAGAAAALVIIAIGMWAWHHWTSKAGRESTPQLAANNGNESEGAFGGVPAGGFRTSDPPPRGMNGRGRGATPVRNFEAVAANARVIVGNGPDAPVRLGDFGTPGGTKLHVWAWKESPADAVDTVLNVQHGGPLALTPDGASIVTSDGRLIQVATGAVKELPNFDGRIRALFFSPDGTALLLFVADSDPLTANVRMLDFPSGRKRFEQVNQFGATIAAAFTPNGREYFVMDPGMTIRRRDALTGNDLAGYASGFSNSITAIAVSADGKMMAAASSDSENHLWDVATGTRLFVLPTKQRAASMENSPVRRLLFSPDGKYLAAAGLSEAFLWNVSTGAVEHMLPRGTGGGSHLRFYDEKTLTIISGFRIGGGRSGDPMMLFPTVVNWSVPAGN